MSEHDPRGNDETAPIQAQNGGEEAEAPTAEHRVLPPDPAATSAPPPPGGTPPRQSWTKRAWSLPAVIAVALVAVVLGGLGGAALATASNHDDRGRPGFGRFPGGGPGMPPGQRGFGQGPGQGWRFNDPYGRGQRQWGQDGQGQMPRQMPRRPGGQVSPRPTPPTPSASP